MTTDLVMRSAPGGGDNSIVFPGVLDAPTQLFVIDGPVADSGYDWYLVQPFSVEGGLTAPPEHWRLAWVAAGSRDGEPWIAPTAVLCPDASLDALRSLTALGIFACYGSAPLTVDGAFGGCSYVTPGSVEPLWLGSDACSLHGLGTPPDVLVPYGGFLFHVPDGSPASDIYDLEPGTSIRIHGEFDHEAARTCVRGPLPGPEPTPVTPEEEVLAAEAVILYCRARLVLTAYDVLP